MVYDYVITKPELNEDTLAHYGIKGMKWKKRLKGAYYSYKSKMAERRARKMRGMMPRDLISNGSQIVKPNVGNGSGTKMARVIGVDHYKAGSHSGQDGLRLHAGLEAARTRKKRKELARESGKPENRPRSRKKNIVSGTGSVYKR